MKSQFKIDPNLDLVLERVVDVKPDLIWKAWTQPKHLMPWFCPLPWKTVDCHIDLKPGGEFSTVMQSPEGQKFPNSGCYLEIVENRKLVWTSALLPGYRPVPKPENGAGLLFTAAIIIEPQGDKSKYTAIGMHKDSIDRKTHEDMGFQEGWGKALDQLVSYSKEIK